MDANVFVWRAMADTIYEHLGRIYKYENRLELRNNLAQRAAVQLKRDACTRCTTT